MKHLLPIPTSEIIPSMEGSEHLTDMLDRQFNQWFEETVGLEYLRDPARCPPQVLDEFGYILSADIANGDSERIKRVKIATAIDHQKARGTWPSVKELIDAWSGGDSKIFDVFDIDDFILVGAQIKGGTLWSILGGIEEESPFGIALMSGTGADGFILNMEKGNIYIDVGLSNVSDEVIDKIIKTIINIVPAYFAVYLGYIKNGDFLFYGEVT
jgi:phage tail P2-like protein